MIAPPHVLDRRQTLKTLGLGWLLLHLSPASLRAQAAAGSSLAKALELSAFLQEHFWDSKRDLYRAALDKHEPDFIWGGGVMFSSLVAAARHEKRYGPLMRRYFKGLDGYWDTKVDIPGYEPAPTGGGGNDKYYDDNAWMVLTFLEAYELTGESRYLKRADETLRFVLSGWDEQLGGGIWWHEQHKEDCKNTCVNGPAALGCFRLSKFRKAKEAEELVAQGQKIVEWTVNTLQASNSLFKDSIKVSTGEINHDQLTYNSGLMLRCFLWLHAYTGKAKHLTEARRIGNAAEALLDSKTGVYRDPPKWTHLMVEADLELFRRTKQKSFFSRAKTTADAHYEAWKQEPPKELIENASIARELWLLADLETPSGRQFWETSDRVK